MANKVLLTYTLMTILMFREDSKFADHQDGLPDVPLLIVVISAIVALPRSIHLYIYRTAKVYERPFLFCFVGLRINVL